MTTKRQANSAVTRAKNTIDALFTERERLQKEIKRLDRLGHVHATMHQQEKRPGYVVWYMNIPGDNGDRQRKYVGRDKQKIKDAEAMIARHAKWNDLHTQLDGVQQGIDHLHHCILEAAQTATDWKHTQSRMW